MDTLAIALAQLDFTVGDLAGNKARILDAVHHARNPDIIVFPELAITGYPPEDLVLKESFQKQAMQAVRDIARETQGGPIVILGGIWVEKNELYNCGFILHRGKIVHIQPKYALPNYGIFDEKRVFAGGSLPKPVNIDGLKIGLMVCEDMWNKVPQSLRSADILISINASPFEKGKVAKRIATAESAQQVTKKPIIYVNQVAGQDDIVFDGGSFIMNKQKNIVFSLPAFEEAVSVTLWQKKKSGWHCESKSPAEKREKLHDIYQAMMLGLRDYVNKNRFSGVILGLSGGIDSAITAAIAVDALGADKVQGVLMPSRYTSSHSNEDAKKTAKLLGIKLHKINIEPMVKAFDAALKPVFKGTKPNIAEENIQSRIRGMLLMAISNKFGPMVMTTGNKSELATGYATLYGDMCGGYNVLKDVYKTEVYALSKWRNDNLPKNALGERGTVIPKRSISKAPTAELRENQIDQDTLPPYVVLDGILEELIENETPIAQIARKAYRREIIEKISKMLYASEYKRRQSAPGVKISTRSFNRDRRYPVTNRFKEE